MKKSLLFAMVALATLASCSKQQDSVSLSPGVKGQKAVLNVSVSGGAAASSSTKASAETLTGEAAVNSLQVFVFSGDQLDVYGSKSDGSTALSLTASTGARTVVALVNAPDLSSVVSLAALKASVSSLSDNASDSFVMVGTKAVTLTASSDITVNVDRIAARIRIKKITRSMSASGLAGLAADKFKVVRLYVADAATDNTYDLSKASGYAWENSTLAASAGALATTNTFLYNKLASAAQIAQGASLSQDFVFYTYPNATAAESASALFTRLVIECLIDGQYYTYPVIIPGIASNKSYEINELVLTRLGNQSNGDDAIDAGEQDKIESFDIPFGITVNDWTLELLGDSGTVTI